MCGRFSQTRLVPELVEAFGLAHSIEVRPRYNIAPSQAVAAVRLSEGGRALVELRWGLVPGWMKEPPADARMINARAETAAEKPSYRAAFRRRRCLVPADGFYEWQRLPEGKQPYYIRRRDRRVFAFAGLWERWERDEHVIESCTLLTTDANELLQPVHDRMPVILDPADYGAWLGELSVPDAALAALCRPCPSEWLEAYPVNTLVNNPRHDEPACVAPLAPNRNASA